MNWSDIPRDPQERTLRQFGGLLFVFAAALAYRHASSDGITLGVVLLSIVAVVGGLLGLLRPQLLRPIFVGWLMLAFPIGWCVSRVFVATLYYGLVTPMALVFRWCGRDSLVLRRDAERASYWETKPAVTELSSYLRQY